ncbi:MAG: protein kinase family protein [Limisphaerales bacterium]
MLRPIDRGAYGEVWLARNVMGVPRAVKVVYQNSFHDRTPYEREYRGIQKFEPISRSNDGFVDILQIGRNDEQGYFYYVMELADDAHERSEPGKGEGAPASTSAPAGMVAGKDSSPPSRSRLVRDDLGDGSTYSPKTLRTEIRQRGRLPFEECLRHALWLSLALGHLHRQGLIHRDIKPSNIIFVHDVPKLADIGLVTEVDEARSLVGTEGFVPPEGANSPCSDIYSLGKVLYEMSMGKDRTRFPEPFSALGQAPDSADLEELNVIIVKACAPDPRDRYQTAEEMHVDLAMVQSGKSVKWRRVVEKRLAFAKKAGAVGGLIAALAICAFLFQRHQTGVTRRLLRHSEDLANRLQIQNAENLFARGESSLALTQLAEVLRRDPDSRIAAERIMAALALRSFPQLAKPPWVHPAKIGFDALSASRHSAHLSPDGDRIVAISGDFTVRFWSVNTGEPSAPPHAHQADIYSLEFSPDGRRVVSASEDGTAWILDARSGAPLVGPLVHESPVYAATFSPDGRWIATVSADSNARVFDAATGQPLAAPLAHTNRVNTIAFSPDSALLATGTEGGGGHVWEVSSGRKIHHLGFQDQVRRIQFSGNGRWLAGSIYGSHTSGIWRVQAWNVDSGDTVGGPFPHQNRIYGLAFSPDSDRLVTATADNAAVVWDVARGREILRLPHSSGVYSAVFSPDGGRILTASMDGTARLWDATTGVSVSEPMRHEARILHAEFSRDGERVLTVGWQDKTIKLWNAPAPRSPSRMLRHRRQVVAAEFDATGRLAITATGANVNTANHDNSRGDNSRHSVTVWDLASDNPKLNIALPDDSQVLAATFTPTGPKALIIAIDGSRPASLWDFETRSPIGVGFAHETPLTAAAFSPDGGRLATASRDGVTYVRDATRGRALAGPMVHRGKVNCVRFSPDGLRLITASDDRTAVIWDAVSGEQLVPALRHQAEVWYAQFNPAGDRVVTTSLDNTAVVWASDGARIAEMRHGAPIEFATFSADGTQVATASGDRTARLWNAVTGQPLTEPLRHAELVTSVRFSPDGLRVITASKDGTAQVWDAATGLKLGDPLRHDAWVHAASFAPDGRQAITASLDGTARIWPVPIAERPIRPGLVEQAESAARGW